MVATVFFLRLFIIVKNQATCTLEDQKNLLKMDIQMYTRLSYKCIPLKYKLIVAVETGNSETTTSIQLVYRGESISNTLECAGQKTFDGVEICVEQRQPADINEMHMNSCCAVLITRVQSPNITRPLFTVLKSFLNYISCQKFLNYTLYCSSQKIFSLLSEASSP